MQFYQTQLDLQCQQWMPSEKYNVKLILAKIPKKFC